MHLVYGQLLVVVGKIMHVVYVRIFTHFSRVMVCGDSYLKPIACTQENWVEIR
jgi:hypothetical protein